MPTKLSKYFVLLFILLGLVFFTVWRLYAPIKYLELDFLAVGQGDAELIKTPAGQNILIDGGPDQTVLTRLAENLPWWDRQIDLMILTHPHDDHVTGLTAVLDRYRVKQVLYTGLAYTSPNYQAWLDTIKRKHIPLVIINRPEEVQLAVNCKLQLLYPLHNLAGQAMANANNSSIVAKLVYGQTKILFTGDAELPEEQELMAARTDVQADLLKIPHHGSDNGTSEAYLGQVGAKLAVIEAGKGNPFGHPSLRTVNKLERANYQVFRTDLLGTVRFWSDGQRLWQP